MPAVKVPAAVGVPLMTPVARSRLSPIVERRDAERAIRNVNYFLEKLADDGVGLDIDLVLSGTSKRDRDLMPIITDILRTYGADGLSMEGIVKYAADAGIGESKVRELVEKMEKTSDIFCPRPGLYKYTGG